MENKNGLAADLISFKNGITGFFGHFSKSTDEYTKIANYNNPKQVYDNYLRLVKVVLFLAASVSFGIGVTFHYKLFLNFFGNELLAVTVAIILFLVVEMISVFGGINTFKLLFTGRFKESFLDLFALIMTAVVIGICFFFRFDISANAFGGQYSDTQNTEISVKEQKLAKDTKSSYDDDIKDARATIAKGRKQTWAGKLTPDGEEVVKQGNKSLQKLLALKEKELGRRQSSDSSFVSSLKVGVESNKDRVGKYGGIIELTILFFTLLYALFQNLSYRKNKEGIESGDIIVDEKGNLSQAGGQQTSGFNNYGQGSAYLNQGSSPNVAVKPEITAKTETKKIGFKHYEPKNAVVAAKSDSEEKKNFT